MEKILEKISRSAKGTMDIAKEFAASFLKRGDVVCLEGDLGAGKTVFAKGVVSAFSDEGVTSPTFTIMNLYAGKPLRQGAVKQVAHFDLYRLSGEEEFFAAGLHEFLFDKQSISLVEWPSRAAGLFNGVFSVFIKRVNENERDISIFKGKFNEFKHFSD